MTIADKLKQIKQSTDAIKASVTALTGEVQTDLTSIATELDKFNPANATDLLAKLGYNSNNAPDLYNALLNSLEERESYQDDTTVLLPKLTLDENGVYTVQSKMFNGSTILTIPKGKYSSSGFNSMFEDCANLLWIPDLELSSTYSAYSHMFNDCTALRTVGNLNTAGCSTAFYMFNGCVNLESIASLDTSSVTEMSNMFAGCAKLKSIPQLDTSNVTKMRNMFNGCSALESLPQLDTSKVTDMSYIFNKCAALSSIPQLDYSSVTTMTYGFSYCTGLTTIPDLNFESATSLSNLFDSSSNIVTVGKLNTPNITNVGSMFANCSKLEKIESIDVQSVNTNYSIAGYSNTSTLKYVVFKNLGQSYSSWDFSRLTNWGVNSDTVPDAKQSLLDTLITYSYDRVSAGKGACTVKLSSTTKALLTDDEITQIATKGYTIA